MFIQRAECVNVSCGKYLMLYHLPLIALSVHYVRFINSLILGQMGAVSAHLKCCLEFMLCVS